MASSGSCSAAGNGQFKATRIWNILVHHMQENVNVKRRKNSKKCYDECFAGCHAVDILHTFVQSNPELFSNSLTIARENIVRLCQSFLDMGIIEGAASASDVKVVRFDDSPTSLYFFADRLNKEDLNPTLLRGRTVLREIDGELRNSLGHISISNDEQAKLKNSSTLQRTKNLLVPLRNKSENRSRFPSFGKLKGQSLKQTLRNSMIHAKSEDDGTDTRGSRKLKRTSSFAGMVTRSSSDTNLHKSSSASSSSDFESADEKEKKSSQSGSSVSRRFSQRLSFRKRSSRKSEAKDLDAGHSSSSSRSERKLSPQELSHIQRECIRVRLLQILDIPFVEELVTSPPCEKKPLGASTVTSSSHHVNYSEVVTSYKSSDPWISSALALLHHLPDGYEILRRHAKESAHMKKIKLYFAISDHYKSLSWALVDVGFSDIINALVRTLDTKPASDSLQALQLFLHLLPGDVLLQLRHLVDFLHHVISSDDVTLAPRMTNSTLVLRTFSPVVFPNSEKHRDVTFGLASLLRLTIEQRRQAFTLPHCVLTAVDRKRHLVETGKVESPSMIPNSLFSQPVSGEDYTSEAAAATQTELSDLARYVLTDDNLSQRKKKDFLKKLQSSHHSVYSTLRPLKPSHNPPPVTPSSDTLSRRRNKPRKQVYV